MTKQEFLTKLRKEILKYFDEADLNTFEDIIGKSKYGSKSSEGASFIKYLAPDTKSHLKVYSFLKHGVDVGILAEDAESAVSKIDKKTDTLLTKYYIDRKDLKGKYSKAYYDTDKTSNEHLITAYKTFMKLDLERYLYAIVYRHLK